MIFTAGWASWANWSVCSGDDKGTNGTRARTRVCTGATIGSRWCPAEQAPESQLLGYLQIDSCSFLQGFPLFWSGDHLSLSLYNALSGFANSWTEWSACSVTCGVGLQRRERPCLTGELGLSEDCPLDFGLEERPCAEKSCGETFYNCSNFNWTLRMHSSSTIHTSEHLNRQFAIGRPEIFI